MGDESTFDADLEGCTKGGAEEAAKALDNEVATGDSDELGQQAKLARERVTNHAIMRIALAERIITHFRANLEMLEEMNPEEVLEGVRDGNLTTDDASDEPFINDAIAGTSGTSKAEWPGWEDGRLWPGFDSGATWEGLGLENPEASSSHVDEYQHDEQWNGAAGENDWIDWNAAGENDWSDWNAAGENDWQVVEEKRAWAMEQKRQIFEKETVGCPKFWCS